MFEQQAHQSLSCLPRPRSISRNSFLQENRSPNKYSKDKSSLPKTFRGHELFTLSMVDLKHSFLGGGGGEPEKKIYARMYV